MNYTEHFVDVNDIRLHYIQYSSSGPVLLLLHGLTANAHAFDGVVAAGLAEGYAVYSVDLRGRGLSDHPPTGYSMEEHAADILGLMDHLGLQTANFCGHSFGGFVSLYIAARNPERVDRLVLLDAAVRMHERTAELLGHRLSKLDAEFPSWEAYLDEVRAAPYLTFWDEAMRSYYAADVRKIAGGGVTPRPGLTNIIQASLGLRDVSWAFEIERVTAPVLLINAPGIYADGEALLPEDNARETVAILRNARYAAVSGNHQTMLYGAGAREIVAAIRQFVPAPVGAG